MPTSFPFFREKKKTYTTNSSSFILSNLIFAIPLKDVFDDFRKSKATLEKIHNDTVQYFTEIARTLSNPRDGAIAAELGYAGSPSTSPDEVKVMVETAAMTGIHQEFDMYLAK